ncbi:MAG TPA: T9SS type A sorting domain-containing protein [Bacteroidota bacterium]
MKQVLSFLFIFLLVSPVLAQGPPVPDNLQVQQINSAAHPTVKLTWHVPPGPWGFKIYRSANDTSSFSSLGLANATQFYDHNVDVATTYFYYVTSVRFSNGTLEESAPSNIAEITIVGVTSAHGVISGTVMDDSTGDPLSNILIKFFAQSGGMNWMPYTFTDSLGHYSKELESGTYLILAAPLWHWPNFLSYIPEWFDNAPSPMTATPVEVTDSSSFVADFGLSRRVPPTFAFVSGTVTDTAGNPLRRARVAIIRTMQEMTSMFATTGMTPGMGEEAVNIEGVGHTRGVVWHGYTDSLGNYTARVISGKNYIVMASKAGFIPEYFDNKTNPAEADIISVSGDTSGIDFSLAVRPVPQNSISGMVQDSTGVGVVSRIVLIPVRHNVWPHRARFGHTDSLGAYTITEVHEGDYYVLALPFSGYAPSFYKAGVCGMIRWHDADTVHVAGNVTGIDVCVAPINNGGVAHIGGRITAQGAGNIEGVHAIALRSDGMVVGYGLTDASGRYVIDAVSPGNITIVADRDGYVGNATSVAISPSTFNIENVNLTLTPVSPTSVGAGNVPTRYSLEQNYPNPFNPSTTIEFSIPAAQLVTLKVYNLLGQEVATLVNGQQTAGAHSVHWNASSLSTGFYFYKMETGNFSQTRKLMLMK